MWSCVFCQNIQFNQLLSHTSVIQNRDEMKSSCRQKQIPDVTSCLPVTTVYYKWKL